MADSVVVLGSFVVDVAFRMPRLPAWGETVLGSAFALGPGGKGSNQAVAAARAGAAVTMLSKVADDAFGGIARTLWTADGIDHTQVLTSETPTGSAAILIDEATGENAIVVTPGACYTLTAAEMEMHGAVIREAGVLLVQLELPVETVAAGLRMARAAGVRTILNPAPAPGSLADEVLALADFVIPNESEAAALTGLPVETEAQVEAAADGLRARGAGAVIVTLGARGSLLRTKKGTVRIPAFSAGEAVDTTGAGDAFCGAFAAGLVRGLPVEEAARFASAGAAVAVTRRGAAVAMARRTEIEALLE